MVAMSVWQPCYMSQGVWWLQFVSCLPSYSTDQWFVNCATPKSRGMLLEGLSIFTQYVLFLQPSLGFLSASPPPHVANHVSFRSLYLLLQWVKIELIYGGYHNHTFCGHFFSLKRCPKLQILACGNPRKMLALRRYPHMRKGLGTASYHMVQ
jgi:hypothetical protein